MQANKRERKSTGDVDGEGNWPAGNAMVRGRNWPAGNAMVPGRHWPAGNAMVRGRHFIDSLKN